MNREELASLHDSTLRAIAVDWAANVIVMELNTTAGAAELVMQGTRAFSFTCDEPWGSSKSINEVRSSGTEHPGQIRLEIELQSGDMIRVDCSGVRMTR